MTPKRAAAKPRAYELPADPWQKFLLDLKERNDWNYKELATYLGVNDRAVRRWIHEATYVNLDAVDKVCIHLNEPELLNELWPLEDENEETSLRTSPE